MDCWTKALAQGILADVVFFGFEKPLTLFRTSSMTYKSIKISICTLRHM